MQEVTEALTAMTTTREYAPAGYYIHRDLANLIGHKKKTADKYYRLEDQMESVKRAAEQLPVITHTSRKVIQVKGKDKEMDESPMCSEVNKTEQHSPTSSRQIKFTSDESL